MEKHPLFFPLVHELANRHSEPFLYLVSYLYLNPQVPTYLSSPVSPWILSHALDSLSVIQRWVFLK